MSYSLLEAFKELNEEQIEEKINFTDIRTAKVYDDSVFNFLITSDHLCSAIEHQSLYTQKRNDSKNKQGQWDYISADLQNKTGKKWAYCCLTFNPIKLSCSLLRPFGIEFDYPKLASYAKSRGCELYDYDQFKVKTEVSLKDDQILNTKTGKSYSSMELRIAAIGKYKTGEYFIVIQQWQPREISKSMYDKILSFLKVNCSNYLLHFINNDSGKVLMDFLDTDNSTEEAIKINSKSYVKLKAKPIVEHFKEVSEIWSVAAAPQIGLTGVGKSSQLNTYIKPLKFPSKELLDNSDILNDGTWLDKESLKELSTVFNEYELRIYVPNDNDFYFKENLIKSVWLPESYKLDKPVMLKEIFMEFDKLGQRELTFNDQIYQICFNFLLGVKTEIEKLIHLYNVIKRFNLKINFYKYNVGVIDSEERTKYLSKSGNVSNLKRGSKTNTYRNTDLHGDSNFKDAAGHQIKPYSRDHTRYLLSSEKLNNMIFNANEGNIDNKNDIEDDSKNIFLLKDKKGNDSVIYTQFKSNGLVAEKAARIGAEAIIIGKDEDNNYYLKLTSKPEFNELPGGSFNKIPLNTTDVINGVERKLKIESGINANTDLKDGLKLFNKALYMYEGKPGGASNPDSAYIKKVSKNIDKLKWYFSCYWLAGGIYKYPINKSNLDIDTKTKDNPHGEISRWFKINNLKNDFEFMSRYGNIVPLIDKLIELDKTN